MLFFFYFRVREEGRDSLKEWGLELLNEVGVGIVRIKFLLF